MWVWNQLSVTNLNTIAHICLLAVAIASVTTQANQPYRKLCPVHLLLTLHFPLY